LFNALETRTHTSLPSNPIKREDCFANILERRGLAFEKRGVWVSVGETQRVQGWKLHISSIPGESISLLECVIPLLTAEGVSFKLIANPSLLGVLNEGGFGDFQVGKFITIYPTCDAQARRLADLLVNETSHFHGPIVATDLRIGEVVYARYGGFQPVIQRDRLGQQVRWIYDTDGILRRDHYSVPFEMPNSVANPFKHLERNVDRTSEVRRSKLFGPGYLILEVVKVHPKGAVFLAVNLLDQSQVGLRAIKQGRQFCLSDDLGRDMRERLRHQARLAHLLAPKVRTPPADEYFEIGGHGYLPLEWVEGVPLLEAARTVTGNRPWANLADSEVSSLLCSLRSLAETLESMHMEGFVHRDLSPTNVLVRPDGTVYLIDLELTHILGDSVTPYGKGTPGYISPEQEMGKEPTTAQDVFSFGCLLVLLLTGCDPQRVLWPGVRNLEQRLRDLSRGANPALITLAMRCVAITAAARPTMAEVRAVLQEKNLTSRKGGQAQFQVNPLRRAVPYGLTTLQRVISRGAQALLKDSLSDKKTGLWLSAADDIDPASGAHRSFEVRRDAHHGVAGVLYALARLVGLNYIDPNVARSRVDAAITWLSRDYAPQGYQRLPGLYFGDAGVAVALLETKRCGFDVDESLIQSILRQSMRAPLDWHDVTHGAAGQGIAALLCERLVENPEAVAHRFVDYLTETQLVDGSWRVPPGVDGLSGQVLSGFAHGCAGVVCYLSACQTRFGFTAAEEACKRGTAWLIESAKEVDKGRALEWDYSNDRQERWKWWCHGSPGIALAFLQLYRQTENGSFAEIAEKALNIHVATARTSNLSTCHGLVGLGEIYLEAASVLGERKWLKRAEAVASTALMLARSGPGGRINWLVEDPYQMTADLMVGSAGVLHFLARLDVGDSRLGFPMLLPSSPARRAQKAGGRSLTHTVKRSGRRITNHAMG
jgi:serine/threonine protein kinase